MQLSLRDWSSPSLLLRQVPLTFSQLSSKQINTHSSPFHRIQQVRRTDPMALLLAQKHALHYTHYKDTRLLPKSSGARRSYW